MKLIDVFYASRLGENIYAFIVDQILPERQRAYDPVTRTHEQ